MDFEAKDQDKKSKSLITGLIVGGAVGSVLSLLFAPDPGQATRKKAASKGKWLWGKVKQWIKKD